MDRARATLVRMAYQSARALQELAAFALVVEHGGFSSAARQHGVRKATLIDQVTALEKRLGAPLLQRTTRTIRLTEEGRTYFDHARRTLEAAREAEASVTRAKSEPTGLLRVTAHPAVAAAVLGSVMVRYVAENPRVRVELDTSHRRRDLVRDGFDLAVRVGPLEDSTLLVRKLGTSSGGYYASPDYLERRGTPSRIEDLQTHDAIVVRRGDRTPQWPFLVGRKRIAIRPPARVTVSSFELAAQAAAAGMGILRSPHHFVRETLAAERLVPVLTGSTPPPMMVHAVFTRASSRVAKTRVFMDLLARGFRSAAEEAADWG